MHDLNTITKLNNEACEGADYWRKRGKWVVRATAGLHVTDVCTFDTLAAAMAYFNTCKPGASESISLLHPHPATVGVTRDQSEDRGVSYDSVEAFVRANPSARPGNVDKTIGDYLSRRYPEEV